MPQKRPRIVPIGAALCVFFSLMGTTISPFNTQSLLTIFAYELSMIAGSLAILFWVYRKGFTE
ncbi:MAG: hypothetical protein C4K49_04745 [Candidatus Thorarchaeota archaeon]|nr:MAG: hypothetical protein C4K49_04745 [Candidatus Thorarchaeota archaeon]